MLKRLRQYNIIKHRQKDSCMANTVNSEIFTSFIFRETSHMRSFVKIKPSRNGNITLSCTNVGKSCPRSEFLTLQICLLTIFAKLKFSRKFWNLAKRKILLHENNKDVDLQAHLCSLIFTL